MAEPSPELVERYRAFLKRVGSPFDDIEEEAKMLAAQEASSGVPSVVVWGRAPDGRLVECVPGEDDRYLDELKPAPKTRKRSAVVHSDVKPENTIEPEQGSLFA